MYCKNCGSEIDDKAVICIKCGAPTGINSSPIVTSNEPASTGLKIISLLIPLVGLILYLVYNEKEPIKAKECGKFALIGTAIGVGLWIISAIITASLLY